MSRAALRVEEAAPREEDRDTTSTNTMHYGHTGTQSHKLDPTRADQRLDLCKSNEMHAALTEIRIFSIVHAYVATILHAPNEHGRSLSIGPLDDSI